MLVLSVRWASQATMFSKSLVCRGVWASPGHLLGADAPARAAVDAMDVGFEPHSACPEVRVPPVATRRVVTSGRRRTARTWKPASSSTQSDDDALLGERHREHRSAGRLQDPVERRRVSHISSTTRSRLAAAISNAMPTA
jgi:hypothetical protein